VTDDSRGELRHCLVSITVADKERHVLLSVDSWEGRLYTGPAPVESLMGGIRAVVEACAGIDELTAAEGP
jgi:hypothetical protein